MSSVFAEAPFVAPSAVESSPFGEMGMESRGTGSDGICATSAMVITCNANVE